MMRSVMELRRSANGIQLASPGQPDKGEGSRQGEMMEMVWQIPNGNATISASRLADNSPLISFCAGAHFGRLVMQRNRRRRDASRSSCQGMFDVANAVGWKTHFHFIQINNKFTKASNKNRSSHDTNEWADEIKSANRKREKKHNFVYVIGRAPGITHKYYLHIKIN